MRLSIVTISYNQREYLGQAIDSVFGQNYHDVQYIIVDGGSTDGSKSLVEEAGRRGAQIICGPDRGPADALNKGFALADGEIYGFINSDDYYYPQTFKKIVEQFERHPEIDVLSGHADVVDGQGRVIRHVYSDRFSPRAFAYSACNLVQQSTFFRADFLRKCGGFNINNRIAWDGELWVAMAEQGARFGIINDILSAFRVWGSTISSNVHATQKFRTFKADMFVRIVGREWRGYDGILRLVYKTRQFAYTPKSLYERLAKGPVISMR